MKRLFTAAMLLVITTISANAQLVINELMQSNVECLFDNPTKEFPDSWVELYNPTDAPIDLGAYKIGTKDKADKAWQLPSQEVPAEGHVVILCDKEGIEGSLHTDFRLESGKDGNLYLFKNGAIVDQLVKMAKMPAPDVAYGRAKNGQATDNGDTWGYELNPTPGEPNSGGVVAASQILGAPGFSELGRVGNATVNLELILPDGAPNGAVIRYTTDGSEPTTQSTKYTKSIRINKTTVIRAKVFCDGWLSPVSTAQSYIFHPRTMTVPIISILTKKQYIDDKTIGIYPNNTGKDNKVDWRRPINIEMFTSESSESVINQLGETRIQGGQSRANALKSMAIYTNKRFEPDKKRFSYQFFPDQKTGITEFKSFSLRDGGNDFGDLYFRDLIIQRTMGENTDLDWQAGHTAVLYINGEYKGMLNIRERSNADNIYSNYNGLEDIDMIEIGHEKKNGLDQYIEELKEGTMEENYNAFKAFYSEEGHTLAEYENWMDVSEYLNIMIMNLFYGNIDFPGNNIVFWRPNKKDTKSGLPKRWRFIAKDTDFGLGLYGRKPDYNTIEMLYNPSYDTENNWAFTEPATRLIKHMLADPDILNLFIDKSCVYMGDFMNASGTGKMIDKIKDEALEEFAAHRVKYNGSTIDNQRDNITNKFNDAKKWLTGYTEYDWWGNPTNTYSSRTDYFYEYIRSHWNLGTAIPVTINKEVTAENMPDEVYVNGIKLTKGVFDGKLFLDRNITLEGNTIDDEDRVVTGWEVTEGTGQPIIVGEPYTFNVPDCSNLCITAILGQPMVTIGEYGAVSFSCTKPLDFTGKSVKAYIVTEQNGNSFIKEQVYKVPANTGLVIEGAKGTYTIPVASASTEFDNVTQNMLLSTAKKSFRVPNDDNFYYGLFYSTTKNRVGFKKKEPGHIFAKGKSYLCLTQEQHQGKEFTELFFDGIIDGIATDIQGANNNRWTDGQIYNLNGQRVDKNYNGVIIVNGKKVINNRK